MSRFLERRVLPGVRLLEATVEVRWHTERVRLNVATTFDRDHGVGHFVAVDGQIAVIKRQASLTGGCVPKKWAGANY